MALYLKVSNSLQALADELCRSLAQQQQSVFQPYHLLTQTAGMNNWLRSYLAEKQGIAAHLKFYSPHDFIHRVYQILGGPYPDAITSEHTRWLIFSLLNAEEFKSKFPDVVNYYQPAENSGEIKRLSLAMSVADLFDQYQIYRTQMIEDWNNNRVSDPKDYSEEWQSWLWRHAQIVSENKLPDKSAVGRFIVSALEDAEKTTHLRSSLPAVYLFGLSILTTYHVQLLERLSAFIDVHVHMHNPAPLIYWQDDRSEKVLALWKHRKWKLANTFQQGNALLSSWGIAVNEAFKLFYQNDAFINSYETVAVVEPPANTLLHCLQNDVFHAATDNRIALSPNVIADGSLSINVCYTPMREVECLYDYLIHLFDQRKEALAASDILVLVNNIDLYADYIRAVFGQANHYLRFYIADESISKSNLLYDGFIRLLQLTEQKFTAENVIQLLENKIISEHFQITDMELIRRCLAAANIRSGINGNEEDETWSISWRYGLQRIIYGVCMSGEDEYLAKPHSFYPIDEVEGKEGEQVIRFVHFVELLIQLLQERKEARNLSSWLLYLEQMLTSFFGKAEEERQEGFVELQQHLRDFGTTGDWFQEQLSYDAVKLGLEQSMQAEFKKPLLSTGGITFCSLIPMRSIPHRVIALLGMNKNFPRKALPKTFDVMQRERQIGDRNIKDNDKHLFLETLLSAQQFLYISYVGADALSNKELPASVLVDELLDYIQDGVAEEVEVRQLLVKKHPLHRFSSEYLKPETGLFTYLNQVATPKKFFDEEGVLSFALPKEWLLKEVLDFFKNPIKCYYNKVMGIYYEEHEEVLPDYEPFDLNKLEEWQLRKTLVEEEADDLHGIREKYIRKGRLPLANSGKNLLEEIYDEVSAIKQYFHTHYHQAEPANKEYEMVWSEYKLKGRFNNIFQHKAVELVFNALKKNLEKSARDKLFGYALKLLFGKKLGAMDSMELLIVNWEKKVLLTIDDSKVDELVNVFLQWFQLGHEQCILCSTKTLQLNEENGWEVYKDFVVKDPMKGGFHHDEYLTNALQQGLFENDEAGQLALRYMGDQQKLINATSLVYESY